MLAFLFEALALLFFVGLAILIACNLVVRGLQDTRVFKAAAQGRHTDVEKAISRGVDIDKTDLEGKTALYWAANEGHLKIAELLVGKGADVNAGASPLYGAAARGHLEVAHLLIRKGARIAARKGEGTSFLNKVFASVGSVDLGQVLEPRATPLHAAAFSGSREMVEMLLYSGAPVSATCKRGKTPLHDAVWGSNVNIDVVKLLVANGANVNAKTNQGITPLHWAAVSGRKTLVEFLLVAGAYPAARTRDGRSVSDFAEMAEHADIVELLSRYHA